MIDNFDPCNNPIHELRLEFGDTDEMAYFMTDESYQCFIDRYGKSPRLLRSKVGMAIAANLAINGYRQRVGQEDAYLGERYKNYMDWLTDKISKPMFSGNTPKVYVGGVFRETVAEFELRRDLIDSTFYKGQTARKPDWQNYRYYYPDAVVEPEEMKNRYLLD